MDTHPTYLRKDFLVNKSTKKLDITTPQEASAEEKSFFLYKP